METEKEKSPKKFEKGTIFLDNTTLNSAIIAIQYSDSILKKPKSSLLDIPFIDMAKLVEALIIHEKLFVEDLTSEYWRRAEPFRKLLEKDIIEVYRISSRDRLDTGNWVISNFEKDIKNKIYVESLGENLPRHIEEFLNEVNPALSHDYISHRHVISNVDLYLQYLHHIRPHCGYENLFKNSELQPERFISVFLFRTYQNLSISNLYRVPYSPQTFRVPIIKYKMHELNILPGSFAQIAVGKVSKIISDYRGDINKFLGKNVIEVDIPPLFAIILKNCKSAEDVIDETLKIRESSNARKFRKWSAEVEKSINETKIDEITKAMTMIDEVATDLKYEFGSGESILMARIDPKIGLGGPVLSALGILKLLKKYTFKSQTVFLHDTGKRARQINSLRDEIDRVFGAKIDMKTVKDLMNLSK